MAIIDWLGKRTRGDHDEMGGRSNETRRTRMEIEGSKHKIVEERWKKIMQSL